MHRIDSATARANVNGSGKTGFHDNADLPNQDATYFTPEWSNALQEEIANVIEGLGLGLALEKSDNGQLLKALVQQFGEKKVLEDAVKDYKELIKEDRDRLDKLEARKYEDTQIGEHIWTSEHFLTPEDVAEYKGYGAWERALQGRVAVGFSDDPEDRIEFRTHGDEYGKSEHTLTLEESAKHVHKLVLKNRTGGVVDVAAADTLKFENDPTVTSNTNGGPYYQGETVEAGGGKAHNNMQQSKTLDCWKRVA